MPKTPKKPARARAQKSAQPEPVAEIRAPEPAPAPDTPTVARVGTGMFTVAHLIDSFTNHVKRLVQDDVYAPATLQWYEDTLKHLDPFDAYPADSLRTHHLAAVSFTNGFVRVLKRLYKWGAAEDLVPKDPFAKLAIPPCGRRERVLSRMELHRLYRVCSGAFRRLLFVQLNTLARPGEIRQLTWGQIDWDNRVIVLVKYKGKKRRRDQLRARCIGIPKHVLRLLRNLHRKSADPSSTGRVFRSPRFGKPWTPNGVRCAMRRARVLAGLDGGEESVVCYTLRHTGATNACRTPNVNLKLIAEVMGHSNTKTTERYCHLNTADVVNTIDRITTRPRRPG